MKIKIISFVALFVYFAVILAVAIAVKQYLLLLLLIIWINVIIIWFVGRTFTKVMLFPNSNSLVSYMMNRSLYKKVTQEL